MKISESTIDIQYKKHINQIILSRFRILVPICIALHLLFNIIDQISYPAHANFFFQIRAIDCFIAILLYLLSFHPKIKDHSVWLLNLGGTTFVLGMAWMVYFTDGSASRYYEGANLVFLAFGMINSFYYKHNIVAFIIQIGFFEFAMLTNPAPFDQINFAFANYFMTFTAFFVIVMTKFYSEQHYKAFVNQENLRLSEAKLATLFNRADKLSKTDELTKIHNRRYFFEMLTDKIKHCETHGGWFYLVIFDIDHFKAINDTYGHSFGDTVLIKISETVKNSIRSNDFLGRYGGDEFIMCIDQIEHDALVGRLTRINTSVLKLNLMHNQRMVPVTISFGAARFIPGNGLTEEKLMELADQELLSVKRNNRGNISINS